MDDLEICKRIGEIEKLNGEFGTHMKSGDFIRRYIDGSFTPYNPLTDDALCFKLMVKHEVSLTYGEYAVTAEILSKREDGDYSFTSQTYNPKRAICLAIIEANNNET